MRVNPLFDFGDLKEGFRKAASFALEKVAERLLSDSRLFVPVLTGQLRDSARVEQFPTMFDAVVEFRVRYSMPYAKTQHEDQYNHPSLGFYGAARYLAKPLELFGDFYLRLYQFEFRAYAKKQGLLP